MSVIARKVKVIQRGVGALLLFVLAQTALFGCSAKSQPSPTPSAEEIAATSKMTPEQAKEVLGESATSWWYGQGVGDTMITVSTIAIFPPSALYFLGQGALELAGYERVTVSDIAPDDISQPMVNLYDGVASVPGRFNATAAGTEYVEPTQAEAKLAALLAKVKSENLSSKQ